MYTIEDNEFGGLKIVSDKTDKIKRKKKKKKIIKYRKPLSVNIGFIVFFAIFAYILIYMAMYFTRDRVSIYEVVYGKNADQIGRASCRERV